MNENATKPTGLDLLRKPFADNQISQKPQPTCSNEEWKKLTKSKCNICGGWHPSQKTIHLSYVGHAALTDRLLDVDPNWNWEPVAFGEDGYPRIDKDGGMWIKLTVCGVTRLGYGDSQGKSGPNATKERIGDALRNAAMRFGAALELWHKGELHVDEDEEPSKTNGQSKSNGAPKQDEQPKRTWKDAVAEIDDAQSAESTATKLHEHFAGHADPHDTIMRNVLAKIAQLVGERKIDESPADAMSAIIREWIIEPTEHDTLKKEAAGVFC